MNKDTFLNDLEKIYDFLNDEKTQTNKLISHLENEEFDKLGLIDDFAKSLKLEMTSDLRFALVTRLVNWGKASDHMVKTLPAGTTEVRITVRSMNVATMPNYVTGPLKVIKL